MRIGPQTRNRCVLLRNGVDPQRFESHNGIITRHGVGFVGVISRWIDFKLLESLVNSLPEIEFEFHGIVQFGSEKLEELCHHSNFNWHGEISPDNVPEFLSKCSVAILPYDPEVAGPTIGDSMKIFEYLAAGTPVVATNFQPFLHEKFSGLIEICKDREQFVEKTNILAKRSPNPDWQSRAWQFVLSNSWDLRVESILHLVGTIT